MCFLFPRQRNHARGAQELCRAYAARIESTLAERLTSFREVVADRGRRAGHRNSDSGVIEYQSFERYACRPTLETTLGHYDSLGVYLLV